MRSGLGDAQQEESIGGIPLLTARWVKQITLNSLYDELRPSMRSEDDQSRVGQCSPICLAMILG